MEMNDHTPNPHPFNLDISVREVDPWLHPPHGYEDRDGNYVQLMTDDEVEEYRRKAEGQRFLRVTAVCNGQRKTLETPWFPNYAAPAPYLKLAMEKIAESITLHRPHLKEPKQAPDITWGNTPTTPLPRSTTPVSPVRNPGLTPTHHGV